jgi:hypothetical protein
MGQATSERERWIITIWRIREREEGCLDDVLKASLTDLDRRFL